MFIRRQMPSEQWASEPYIRLEGSLGSVLAQSVLWMTRRAMGGDKPRQPY